MKKRLVVATVAVLALGLVGCGKKEEETTAATTEATTEVTTEAATEATVTDATTEEATEETTEAPTDYTFANGEFKNDSLSITALDGWVIDDFYTDDECIKLVKASDADSYDVFNNSSLKITVSKFASKSESEFTDIDHICDNDKQFFDGEPAIEAVTFGDYSGKQLSGQSASYKNKLLVMQNMNLWIEDTSTDLWDNYSQIDIDYEYVSEDDLAEIQSMLETLQVLTTVEAE